MAGRIPTTSRALDSTRTQISQPRGAPPAQVHQTGDRHVNDLQRQIAQSASAMRAHPHGDGLFVKPSVTFIAGTTVVIPHGLARAFKGYEVKNVTGGFARFIRVDNSPASLDAKQIQIRADVNCTADVWVF